MYQPDSIFFYLQQIEEPDKLPLNDQGDYYLLLYKATLWKTGTPDDSLLQIAIRQYKQTSSKPSMYGHALSKAPPIYIVICPIPHY